MNQAQSKTASNLIGNCPSCSGLVRIPSDAKPDITVRCPHCSSSFPIAAMLEDVPELEIVDGNSPKKEVPLIDRVLFKNDNGERKKFVVPSQLAKGSKRRRHRSGHGSANPAERLPRSAQTVSEGVQREGVQREGVQSEPENANQEATVVPATANPHDPLGYAVHGANRDHYGNRRNRYNANVTAPSESEQEQRGVRVHSSQRHRRMKEVPKNQALEFLKIALGGLLAFPIAYLVLLWGVGQDPLKIAPAISKVVPFAVPVKMRALPESESGEKKGDEADDWIEPMITTKPEILNLPDVAPEQEKEPFSVLENED